MFHYDSYTFLLYYNTAHKFMFLHILHLRDLRIRERHVDRNNFPGQSTLYGGQERFGRQKQQSYLIAGKSNGDGRVSRRGRNKLRNENGRVFGVFGIRCFQTTKELRADNRVMHDFSFDYRVDFNGNIHGRVQKVFQK